MSLPANTARKDGRYSWTRTWETRLYLDRVWRGLETDLLELGARAALMLGSAERDLTVTYTTDQKRGNVTL